MKLKEVLAYGMLISIVAFFCIYAAFSFFRITNYNQLSGMNTPLHRQQMVPVAIGDAVIHAYVADTPHLITKGLGGKASLHENEGMLFIFDKPGIQSFWMKDMLIPIDIIWIRSGKVVGIENSIAPPIQEAPDSALPYYYSPSPVTHVLEASSGWAKDKNVNVGDKVVIEGQ